MESARPIDEPLAALASHLRSRREAILRTWRKAIDRDPEMMTGASLPRAQLNDHIPALLDAFEKRLQLLTVKNTAALKEEGKGDASAHGLQRWQQGYDLREVTREWGKLQLCVADELERYASSHPEVDPSVMSAARRVWAELCTEGASESVSKYFDLQQIEAKGHVGDLAQALEQVRELERSRAELWRQAAHDLRGNVGVVMTAAAGLAAQGVAMAAGDKFLRILQKNLSSLHSLLEDVMDLARLQAGHEHRQVKAFDAAPLLRDLCERMQPLAEERGLFLKMEGPSTLPVEGDAVKTQRIAQNLLFNALKYTPSGGVTVSWGDSRQNDAHRWMLCVEDTGPGFHAGPGAPMAGALGDATEEARQVEETARTGIKGTATPAEAPASDAAPVDDRPVHQEGGEGIGLSIVKRLCELLDATIEMDSVPGEGTSLRIVFPRHYDPVGRS
jgi:signal transduction histidine kinase